MSDPLARIAKRVAARNGKHAGTTSAVSDVGQSRMIPPPVVPEYTKFPVNCLPERSLPFASRVAAATNTDPAFVSLYLLSLLSAMVGTTRAIMPKRGWKVFPVVWGCAVGRSASGKTPPLTAIADALTPLVAELDEENRADRSRWEERKAAHLADSQKRGLSVPPEPPPRRLRVSDITVEALAGVLVGNPRGVWMVAEELSGWLSSFTRYKSGRGESDRPKWLTLFDGGALEVDRKGGDQKHLFIRNALVAVAGGIQPQLLRMAMTEENLSSGLFARILLAYPPDRMTEWSEVEVDDTTTDGLTSLLRDLRKYTFGMKDGMAGPVLNTMHPAAKAEFVKFFNANRKHAFHADDAEAAATTKLESYALKFAHLRHLCRYAGGMDSDPVSMADMQAGITQAEWFRGELQRVRALLAEPERMQGQRRLVALIRSKGGGITPRDLQRSDGRRYPDTTAARARLEQLVVDGFGDWKEERATNNKLVERFTLHPDTMPDARRCPTVADDDNDELSDGVPDAANATRAESPQKQGNSDTTSDNVGRRIDTKITPISARQLGTPSDTASGTSTPVVWSDEAKFHRLLRSAGLTWPDALEWLNNGPCADSPYQDVVTFFEVILAHRQLAAEWLTQKVAERKGAA